MLLEGRFGCLALSVFLWPKSAGSESGTGLDWMLRCDSGDWLHRPPGQPLGDLEPGWDTSGEVRRHLASSQVELGSLQFTRLTETLLWPLSNKTKLFSFPLLD